LEILPMVGKKSFQWLEDLPMVGNFSFYGKELKRPVSRQFIITLTDFLYAPQGGRNKKYGSALLCAPEVYALRIVDAP